MWKRPVIASLRTAIPVSGGMIAPLPAAAYHETLGIGGGAPVHVFVLLAVIVAIGMVLLSRWNPRKGKHRAHSTPRTTAGKGRRRRRG